MRAFRVTKIKHKDGLSGEGARLAGGRFNSVGTPLLYLGTTEALVMLEVRVHSPSSFPRDRLFHEIEVPDDGIATIAGLGLTLPANWRALPQPAETAAFGDAWIASGASLGLLVPSAVSPKDMNLLVNVGHPNFGQVKLISSRQESLDPRLW